MKKSFVAAAAVCACAGTALATPSTGSVMQDMDFSFPLSPGMQNLSFNQFDDMGGTLILQKVIMEFDATIGAAVTAENDAVIAAPDFALNLSGFVTVDFGALSGFGGINLVEGSGGVAASDGNPGSGPDFHDFGFVSDSDMGMEMTDSGLAGFIGGGTIDAMVFGSGGFSISGSADATINITDFGASGNVKITYEYKEVPAPAALSLFGIAGLAAGRRRRA